MHLVLAEMRLLFLLFIFVPTIHGSGIVATPIAAINCFEIMKQNIPGGGILLATSPREKSEFSISVYATTRGTRHMAPFKIDPENLFNLTKSEFDPSLPSYVITHGWKSGGLTWWIEKIKNGILHNIDANVFILDWAEGGCNFNYVSSARNTEVASTKLYDFFQRLKFTIGDMKGSTSEIKWNHLSFVGHSLGAHVCGQAAYLLRQDKFWVIERVTGLDPAQPCFAKVEQDLRLDRSDAKFVDVIHTQTGSGGYELGYKNNIGDVDFYVNGGAQQPRCITSTLIRMSLDCLTLQCSHKLAYMYFIESLNTTVRCSSPSFKWDGTYEGATKAFDSYLGGHFCDDCPPMGIRAIEPKYLKKGVFISITSSERPYCNIGEEDTFYIRHVIDHLKGNPVNVNLDYNSEYCSN